MISTSLVEILLTYRIQESTEVGANFKTPFWIRILNLHYPDLDHEIAWLKQPAYQYSR